MLWKPSANASGRLFLVHDSAQPYLNLVAAHSPSIIAKQFSRGYPEQAEAWYGGLDVRTIEKLCPLLDCQLGDIIEYVPDKGETSGGSVL